jgi:uncharacterized membrane protein
MVAQSADNFWLTFVLMFFILILAGFLALYLHLAGFTLVEVTLLVAFPLLACFAALPVVGRTIDGFTGGIFGTVFATAKVFDVPIVHLGHIVIGVNAVGFFIPAMITLNMLVYRRVPWKQFCVLAVIIAAVTYLYTLFQPGLGLVIYLFAIPPILASGIAFMLRRMKGLSNLNTALLAYAGATIGVLVGADLLNLHKLANHDWGEPTMVSVGGGSILDAVFLAGMVALFADFVFRSREENLLGRLVRVLREAWPR